MIKTIDDLPLTMSVEEMGKVLGVSRKTAYKIALKENIAMRVGEKRLRVPKHKLIAYMNNE